jgi:hypothetical protein
VNEGLVVRSNSLPSDEKAPELIVPAVGSLNDPAPWLSTYTPQHRLFTTTANVRDDSAGANLSLGVWVVIPLVEAEMSGSAWSPRRSQNGGVQRGSHHPLVVDVRPRQGHCKRNAASVGQNVPFSAAFCAIGRVGARKVPPFGAFTVALSIEHHVRSTPTSRS